MTFFINDVKFEPGDRGKLAVYIFLGFPGTFFSNSEWGSTQNVLMIVLHWSKQISRNCTHLLPKTRSTYIVREAEVQKYMSTYHIEGQFHFALKLSVTCLI